MNKSNSIGRNASPQQFQFQIPNYQLPIPNSPDKRSRPPANLSGLNLPRFSKFPVPSSQFQIPNSNFLEITISNTGPGIPQDELDKIFDRFYQADTTYKKDSEGSGIGLALTKEFVELHHGTIDVECRGLEKHPPPSPLDRGELSYTTFKILIPIGKNHYKEEEIEEAPLVQEIDVSLPPKKGGLRGVSELSDEITISQQTEPPENSIRTPVSGFRSPDSVMSSPLLLIVEDNPDVTTYIRSFLDHDYRIITARNGKAGWKKTLDKYPDLIISDVMMPEMDGFELCKKIKADENTSHIPVILLTAKADLDSKIEGLEFGADDYISKAFEADELKVRSKNLIEQRKKLREKFSRVIDIKPGEITATSMDELFLRRLLEVFENHVDESDFSTEDFAREVGMSRSNLHRKLQALTNQPTHEFLRTLRLQRAAQLLKKSAGSVTEISYAVGFNNPNYFAKLFRQQFGQTPSNFARKNQD